ncbi:hypothetical protein RF55_16970 [Lasius niger]|uniref:MRN complex-interacting protein N-terminal domain-containing protein n=1 Tax=Lasius niger TaxID=67767 RepID=A0A0J7K3I2_LASNI|nr:hypothetical protein RF55_16970 [Lasius niger]
MYQVHIVKKAPKWHCKVCNAKQFVKQIYFQGSGRDCRLQVQQLNAMKADNTFFISSEQDDVSDACDTFANISQESDSDNAAENKRTKYFESSEIEGLEDVEDFVSDNEFDDITSSKKFPCNNINKDPFSFEKYLDDTGSESEDVSNEKELSSTSFNRNSSINDKCNMQDNTKSGKDYNNAADIFETYDELDDPLDF